MPTSAESSSRVSRQPSGGLAGTRGLVNNQCSSFNSESSIDWTSGLTSNEQLSFVLWIALQRSTRAAWLLQGAVCWQVRGEATLKKQQGPLNCQSFSRPCLEYDHGMKAGSLLLVALALGCSSSDPAPANADSFSWTVASPCPVARFEAHGAVVDGKLWVMGGFLSTALDVTSRVDIYDPSTDSWSLGPELRGAETHAGVVNVGNDIVLVGGFAGTVHDRITTVSVWRWNSADFVWSSGPDLPTQRAAVAAALIGSELHVAGGLAPNGNSDSGEHLVWDLAGAFAWTGAAPLSNPRNHGGGAASGGRFFAVAGRHGWDEVAGHDPALDEFDPATDSWTPRAPLPSARSEIGSATVSMPDGRLLVVGGSITGKLPSADVLVYDPPLDRWSTLPSLPEPRKGVVAARVGAKVIVTTGSPTSTDPSTTTWVGCCL
jgi:N-acetylneuraminic acid mutarotase